MLRSKEAGMNRRMGWLVLAMLMTASLCGATGQKDTAALAAVRAEWAKDLHDKKLDEFVALYTRDGQFLTETGERFAGHDAIRGLAQQAMAAFTSEAAFESKVTEVSGNMAYDSGDYYESLTSPDGKTLHPHGMYLMVLRKEGDGRWRIAVQMWSEARASDVMPH
jgi:uncharacterized protein (TIGR02246 family)